MKAILVRRATAADAAAIAEVHVASWKHTYPGIVPQTYIDSLDDEQFASRWKEQLLLPDTLVLVAVGPDGICGFVGGGPLREPLPPPSFACDGEIYALYVRSDTHRRGVGRSLMREIGRRLVEAGFTRAAVWVLAENPARWFYAKLGGQPVASKTIEIGGAELLEVGYAWDKLSDLIGK